MSVFKDNPGDKIGPYQILLLERTRKKNGHWFGKFLCPFHSEKDPHYFECNISSVRQGATKSCGCQRFVHSKENGRKRMKDLTGQKFGHLYVVKESSKRNGGNHILWECHCDCKQHGIIFVRTNDLLTGKIVCCQQKINRSRGEQKLLDILNFLQIEYNTQYTFNDCINFDTNRKLRFDFYLPDFNCCIEYDGQQHFKKNSLFQESLESIQKRDKIKNKYCKENNIYLLRIPY